MTGADPSLNGLTVSQFLSLTNTALGGGDTGFTFPDLNIELAGLNNAFDDGTVARAVRARPSRCSRLVCGDAGAADATARGGGSSGCWRLRKKRALGRPNLT